MNLRDRPRVGVFGAGAIGGHVGARLSAGGLPVVLFDRPERVNLGPPAHAVDVRGRVHRPGPDLVLTADPDALSEVDVCLVAVKSSATDAVAETLAGVLGADVPVVSLQNGLRNPGRLRAHLQRVVPAVVGFNAVVGADGTTTQTVSGTLFLGTGHRVIDALASALRRTSLPTELRDDIDAVAAGKLLLNLNNGIGGATGLGIAEMLASADARACFSRCLLEGRRVLAAAERPVARAGPLGALAVAASMRLPTWLVRAAAPVHPEAITSTLADLRAGRPTEIDELNGEIVDLARAHGLPSRCNDVVVDAVHDHERANAAGRSPAWVPPTELRARMSARRDSRRGPAPR